MVLALDLIQGIPHGIKEVLVRGNDGAVEPEFDDRLRLMNGVDLALCPEAHLLKVVLGHLLHGDVGRVFDDLIGLAVLIEDRIVARLQPHLDAALCDTLILACI